LGRFVVAPSLETFPIFTLLWLVYIFISEFYFSQTLGMRIVRTKILNTQDTKSYVSIGIVARRHIARISMIWGVFGWFLLFIGKQYANDYIIADKEYSSINENQVGFIEVQNNNPYKIILFTFVIMFILSELQRVW